MRSLLASLLAIGALSSAAAQRRPEVAVGYEEARQHTIQPRHTWVRTANAHSLLPELRLRLTVSPQGDVVHAEAQGTAEEMDVWPIAQTIVYHWKYRPFLRDGHPVTALLDAGISLFPPEVSPRAVPEPALRPDSRIEISLQRTACFGSCPAYSVTLNDQGVLYQGAGHNAVDETHHAPLDRSSLHALAQRMLDAGWFGMNDEYLANWTDNPTQIVTLTVDGHRKKVIDYVGLQAGMPDAVWDIEHDIDDVAGSGRWVRAEIGLVPLLKAEGFDFGSYAAQTALRTAAYNGDVAGVRELLAAGVPRERVPKTPQASDQPRVNASFDGLLTAAARQPEVLRAMTSEGVAAQDTVDKDIALAAAVTAGNAEAARVLLRYGADMHMDFAALHDKAGASAYLINNSPTLLVNAVRSGDPETLQLVLSQTPINDPASAGHRALLVELAASGNREQSGQRAQCARLLLKAGADVHATDGRGSTALHVAQGVPLVSELVEAGAAINAQDHDGNTPAFSTFDPAVFRYLATHRANLTLRNYAGQTALQNPQRYAPEWAPVYAEAQAAQATK